MRTRTLALAILATFSSTLFGQPLPVRLIQSLDTEDHLILAPPAKDEVLRTMRFDPTRDYFGEVSAMLKSSPDAPYLCAALTLLSSKSPGRFFPAANGLRDRELELCKSYPPTKEQIAEVQRWLEPPPPSRREQIVTQLQQRPGRERFFAVGIYAPPPLDPMDWVNGNTHGRDYRTDVEAAFEANPLEAATICVSATHTQAKTADAQKYLPILLDVCKAFPDSKIEAAFAAQKSGNAIAWLTGLMNSFLDEAATLSIDLRRQQANTIVKSFPTTLRSSARFQSALRVIALTPEDWRGPAAALRYAPEASQATPGAQPSEVKAWLDDWYSAHSTGSADVWNWKRGARAFYALTGQLDRARSLAMEIANHRDAQQHSLDAIYLAVIERAAGNRAAYDRVFADCPAPDPFYLQQNGQPPRPVRYCEDIASEFAIAVRDELGTAPAAVEFARIAIETNRVAPTAAASSGISPPVNLPSPTAQLDDQFSSIAKSEEEKVAKMTRVQRDEEVAFEFPEEHSVTLESAIHLLFLEPWKEQGVFAVLKAARSEGTRSAFDRNERIRGLLHDLLERRAASGSDANEWKRGLRAYYLLTGDFGRALDLSRELVKATDPRFVVRDVVLLGLSERVSGDRRLLDDAIRKCPQVPAEALERWGADPFKAGDYCRVIITWDISRTSLLHSTVPNAYKEILAEFGATKDSDYSMRTFAIAELQRLDLDKADRQWRDLLNSPKVDLASVQSAYWNLGWIAEQRKRWQEGMYWLDRYIELFAPTNDFFTPDLWKQLALAPEGTEGRNNELSTAYDARLRLAINAGDFENAHRTIEDMLTFGLLTPILQHIRLSLIQLAVAEVKAGQRQEPLRILGYLSHQSLTSYLTVLLADLRKQLADAEPKREDRPWDSPQRKRRRILVPPPGAKAT